LAVIVIAAVFFFVFNPADSAETENQINAAIQNTISAINSAQFEIPLPSSTTDILPTETSAVENQSTQTPDEVALSPSPIPIASPTMQAINQIAFASDRSGSVQIWIINEDGTGLEQLTNQNGGACQPAWAPKGEAFAFTSPCAANRISYPGAAIYRFDMADAAVSPMTDGGDGDYDSAWSADGSYVAFTSLRLGRSQIFFHTIDSENSNSQSSPSFHEYQPAISADGQQIALISTVLGHELIFIYSQSNPDRIQALTVEQSEEKLVSTPRWAANGDGIYYTRTPRSGGFAELFYLSLSGGGTHHPVFSEAIPARDISISSDGALVAFESWPNTSNHDIWLATVSGTNRIRLTTDSGNDFDASWRP
jgi:TolB protein